MGALVTVAVVTSCSAAGFEKYGRRMLQTLHEHWPRDIPVYLVSEDALAVTPEIYSGRGFEFISLDTASQDVKDFYTRHANNAAAHGGADPARPSDFRFDAWKFSKKVFAINLAAARTTSTRLLWVDADVVTHSRIPVGFFEAIPPRSYALACLDRGKHYHGECGFVAYNLGHEATRPFIAEFERLYTSDEVFDIEEWHDSFVFDYLRRRDNVPTFKIAHRSNSHPFVNSYLGSYMDHLKGTRRKEVGKSPDHPMHLKKKRRVFAAKPRPHLIRGVAR